MRATHTSFLLSLLSLTAALPELAKRQGTTTAATTPTNTVTLDPAASTTTISEAPTSTTTTVAPTVDDPTIIVVNPDCDEDCEPKPEDCDDDDDDDDDDANAAPYAAHNGTAPQPTAVYRCPGEEICHPDGGAPRPPNVPGSAQGGDKPVAPYTGGAAAVKSGVAMVALGLVGAMAL